RQAEGERDAAPVAAEVPAGLPDLPHHPALTPGGAERKPAAGVVREPAPRLAREPAPRLAWEPASGVVRADRARGQAARRRPPRAGHLGPQPPRRAPRP